MRQILIVLTAAVLYSSGMRAQITNCNDDSLYQKINFWVGDWTVYDKNDSIVGYNKIEKILKGCAIMEHWKDIAGNSGKSLFYVDNGKKNWKQVWVTESATFPGGQKEKEMQYSIADSVALFQGQYPYKEFNILDRTILQKLSENEVRQTIEISTNGGQNWQQSFVAIYKRSN